MSANESNNNNYAIQELTFNDDCEHIYIYAVQTLFSKINGTDGGYQLFYALILAYHGDSYDPNVILAYYTTMGMLFNIYFMFLHVIKYIIHYKYM